MSDEFENRLVAGDVTLDEVYSRAWDMLSAAVENRDEPYRTVTMATVGRDNTAQARAVTLRNVDRATRVWEVHTDTRSEKYTELMANRSVSLLFYDPSRRTQIRAQGGAQIHNKDDVAAQIWAGCGPFNQRGYCRTPGPGTLIDSPRSGVPDALLKEPVDEALLRDGYEHFVVVRLTVARLDWLHLTNDGNRAARFLWDDRGACVASWRIP